jgi:Ca2+-binding RTX toxin-like protein
MDRGNRRQRMSLGRACACEMLESRTLLTAFQLYLDGAKIPGPRTIDYGNVALGSVVKHTIAYEYLGNLTVEVSANLGNSGFTRSGDENGKVLSKNGRFTFSYQIQTGRATTRENPLALSYEESNGDSATKEFTLRGTVLPSNAGTTQNFGALVNDVKTPSGSIFALYREDGEGNTLEEVTPYICAFELTAASTRVDLKLTGTSKNAPSPFNGKTSGELSVILVKDANGDRKISINEREAALKTVNTGNIAEDSSATKSGNGTWGPGKYLALVKAIAMRPPNTPTASELGFKLTLTADDVKPPTIDVKGPDGQSISRNQTVELGTIDPNAGAFSKTFSVTNSGESAVSISGQGPNVSDEFVIDQDALSSSIAPGAEPDTFRIRFTNSSDGEATGTVEIQSPNAAGGNFKFFVHATVVQPTGGEFAELAGSTLTVTGTSGADAISSKKNGANFTFTLNGKSSQAFAIAAVKRIIVNAGNGNDGYSSDTQLDIKQEINGGAGNDFLRGGKGADLLRGEDGRDRFEARRGRADTFDGGRGSDVVSYRRRTENLTLSIDDVANDGVVGAAGDNLKASVEDIDGGSGNDTIIGNKSNNRFKGYEGNDLLDGGKGNDELKGGDGDDTLVGGAGTNALFGEAGNDRFNAQNSARDTIDGGADVDSLLTRDADESVINVES